MTDDVEGGRIATRHLVALGHRRIAFIGGPAADELGFTAADDRELGYLAVLDGAGLAVDATLRRYGPHERDHARALAQQLLELDPRPTAVFASSDVQAIGVLEAARIAGLRVPDDLSVVGFDDVEVARYAHLTTVRQPLFDSGRLGADLLLGALRADEPGPAERHELPLELVERATTAPPLGVVA
jgi:DNA-binding LacI/PurR family transcriptional regulator